ncbi:MAG: trimethylamine methyltransferase family protein [Anaerolineae bacterium]|nr:trimethylamine methyltransferase family protein [Anaerolineae bacterium]
MRRNLELLDEELVRRILDEAMDLIATTGVRVMAPEALDLLASAGAHVDGDVARIPVPLSEWALVSAPREFSLYDRQGNAVVRYAGDAVHFDPGSCGVHVLDPETLAHRSSLSADLVRIVQVAEMLPQFAAQSTAVICDDVPKEIGDLYRLFLVLLYSGKPIVTGGFSASGTRRMIAMLAAESGSPEALRAKPRAVFDVCPSPPLRWTEFAAQNLVDLARAWVPAQLVSMPLAGAAAPVTLLGSLVQHAAETISGIVIHQLAQPGAPVVWGGAPAIMDMRTATTPMGAMETAMLDIGYAQVGKHLGLPTHAYMAASDAKIVDAQAGLESGITALLGALAGINMISGAGMLDFLACFSVEKLVVDAEAVAMAQRLLAGIQVRTDPLATDAFARLGLSVSFLELPETRRLFRLEQWLPSRVIDRGTLGAWQEEGSPDTFARARERVKALLAAYTRPDLAPDVERELFAMVRAEAKRFGLARLPGAESIAPRD